MSLSDLKNQDWFKEIEGLNKGGVDEVKQSKSIASVWMSTTGENELLPITGDGIQIPWKSNNVVELGGGENPWFRPNVDIRKLPTVDIIQDLEEDFSDIGKFDGVYASYILEHIGWSKVKGFIKSCYNILNAGGIALLITPNTYEQMEMVVKRGELLFEDSCTIFGGQEKYNNHKWGISPGLINKLFTEAGFNKVECYDHPNKGCWDMLIVAYKDNIIPPPNLSMIEKNGVRFWYRGKEGENPPDYSIINNMFTQGNHSDAVFKLPYGSNVIDIGAHIGSYSLMVKKRRPDLNVYAVEPDLENIALLKKNIAENGLDVTVIPYAISNTHSKKVLHHHKFNFGAHTLVIGEVEHYSNEYDGGQEVECITLGELFSMINVDKADFIKMDIQGEEVNIFKQLSTDMALLNKIGMMNVEAHPLNDDFKTFNNSVRLMFDVGMSVVKIGGNSVLISHKDTIETSQSQSDGSDYSEVTAINFGSFTVTFPPPWINCDIRGDIKSLVESKGHRFMELDVRGRLPWSDNSVDYITHHHLAEHLTEEEGMVFFKECYRILKPHGVMRMSVPDLHKLATLYANGKLSDLNDESDEVKNAQHKANAFWTLITSGHKTMYDGEKLGRFLVDAGFNPNDVTFRACKDSSYKIFENTTELFPKHSLFVEAVKKVLSSDSVPDYKRYLEG